MRAPLARHAALALAATAVGLGIGALALSGAPTATAQGYVPCEQWQAMHPGWPCIDTPTVPPGGPPTVSTPAPLPSQAPGLPPQPGNGGGIGAGALTPPPIPPGNGTPIVPVPGAEPPVLPGDQPPAAQPAPVPSTVAAPAPQSPGPPPPPAQAEQLAPAAGPNNQPPALPDRTGAGQGSPVQSKVSSPRDDHGPEPRDARVPLLMLVGVAGFLSGGIRPWIQQVRGSDGLNPNRLAAINYADEYALHPNGVYHPQGNDCTNFVSQCLQAGGFTPDTAPHISSHTRDRWFPETVMGTPSEAWDRADGLYDYLTNDEGAGNGGPRGREVGTAKLSPVTDPSDPDALEHAGLEPGDIVIYDWGEGEGMSHSAIYVGKDWVTAPNGQRVYGDVVDYHTNNTLHAYWALPSANPADKVTYHFMHLNYSGD